MSRCLCFVYDSSLPVLVVPPLELMVRVGRTIYIWCLWYFWQGNHQIYGPVRCIYTVLANPTYGISASAFCPSISARGTSTSANNGCKHQCELAHEHEISCTFMLPYLSFFEDGGVCEGPLLHSKTQNWLFCGGGALRTRLKWLLFLDLMWGFKVAPLS